MTSVDVASSLEIWGGLECTINRVEGHYFSQFDLNGHPKRANDLKLFAELGIKKIRYPVLWEQVAPDSLAECNWQESDVRLNELKQLAVDPILGLLHHGSGPTYTSLLDPEFPEKLAVYARLVAKRYPWVNWYTPVNEPLTTARFSCLYGFWFPHLKNEKSFVRALYNQIKGTICAMRAIREINPNAQLLQTDDLGRAQSTPKLAYQTRFENHRRWLSFDLLLGKVDSKHPLYKYLTVKGGLTAGELLWLRENSCAPNMIGINHYLLSNRFLDHRLDLYPKDFHGGNGRHRYADVPAVDTGQSSPPPPEDIFREVWHRYNRPFAITETHLSGGREAQMRWLHEVWLAAQKLRSEGCPIQAVTVWSLLGSFDWNSLCTRRNSFYESGVFDIRTSKPRPTALAKMMQSYAQGKTVEHPLLSRSGYWQEPKRILFAPPSLSSSNSVVAADDLPGVAATKGQSRRPVLIIGANGRLGQAFARTCEKRGIDYVLSSRQEIDISDLESVKLGLLSVRPWAVINTAGYTRIEMAEQQTERCFRENTLGPKNLALVCSELELPLLTLSSDLVFDGAGLAPYRESNPVAPLNQYGISKAEAERLVLQIHPQALVVRSSTFFNSHEPDGFLKTSFNSLKMGRAFCAPTDSVVSPTYIPDLIGACLDLLMDGESGLVHLTNQGSISWADWALWAADELRADRNLIQPCTLAELGYTAPRPRNGALISERFDLMPPLEHALHRYMNEVRI